jgi:hypothetical protein
MVEAWMAGSDSVEARVREQEPPMTDPVTEITPEFQRGGMLLSWPRAFGMSRRRNRRWYKRGVAGSQRISSAKPRSISDPPR